MHQPAANPAPRPHADLRTALVNAGLELLDSDGLPGLTLRACAARAGVSHAAPAHHFAGLPGLLGAIAAQGFAIFRQTMIQQRDAAGCDPHATLVGICHGYLRFAAQNPALFTMMFNQVIDKTNDPDFARNAAASYTVLAQACAPFEPITDNPASTETMIWSLVHGLACLRQGGLLALSNQTPALPDITDILPVLTLRPNQHNETPNG